MKFQSTSVLLGAAAPSIVSAFCHHGTSLWSRSAAKFGYEGTSGPVDWALLDGAYVACARGRNQSPANLVESQEIKQIPGTSLELDLPKFDDGMELENLGTTLEVVIGAESGASLEMNDMSTTRASLLQFHFHTPSEHHINGEHYPMEVHFVFEDGGALFVLGIPIEIDSDNDELITEVFENLSEVTSAGSSTHTGPLDFDELTAHIARSKIWTYNGSLTTPPCSEVVTWFVVNDPITVSPATYKSVKSILGFNARYTQNTPGSTNLIEFAHEGVFANDSDNDNDGNDSDDD